MSKMDRRKRDELKLDIISKIDDDIIDRVTARILGFLRSGKRKKRKKIVALIAIAATLALMLGSLFVIVPMMTKQVPIYKGMSVSSARDSSSLECVEDLGLELLSNNGKDNGNNSGGDKHSNEQTEKTGESSSVGIVESEEVSYYAKKNEDIYITVHIDNPDEFEIVSFTLNGTKYTNYMFEEGSDLEHLILRVNVGEAQGYVEYTIDAIKYIDGTKIKDVRMDGDKTVKVGVYPEDQPTAELLDEKVDYGSLELMFKVDDRLKLITDKEAIRVDLYDEKDILVDSEKADHIEEVKIRFDGLSRVSTYKYSIVITYDGIDGYGMIDHIMHTGTVRTTDIMVFESVEVDYHEVNFTLGWVDGFEPKILSELTLYQGETKVKDVDVNAQKISDLISDTEYALVGTYMNGDTKEIVRVEFKTPARTVSYTVNHYLQNANDDGYTLKETETLYGTENTTVKPSVKSFDHYKSPSAVTKTILPDGSLKIDYYYDLITYKTAFVTNGGKPIETVTNKYGATIELPVPEREGYTFGGWYTNSGQTSEYTKTVQEAKDITIYAYWLEETKANEFTFDSGCIIKIIGSSKNVVIPEYIGGEKVTSIGIKDGYEGAVTKYFSIENVTIADGVVSIGSYFFRDCTKLINVILPESLTVIEEFAFYGCKSLKSVDFPDELEKIGRYAFYGNTNMESVEIPKNVTEVGDYAFYANTSLESVILSDSVKYIGEGVFQRCSNLKYVTFPETLENVGNYAFAECISLETLNLKNIAKISGGMFSGCLSLQSIDIPNSVVDIGNGAFMGCTKLDSVTLGTGVVYIGGKAFYECANLKDIVISDSVKNIGRAAFLGCEKLEEICLPDELVFIGEEAFQACRGLESITIPKGITEIKNNVFYLCENLTEVVLPEGIVSIGALAFADCARLGKINIPNEVTSIGGGAFSGCGNLKEINIPICLSSIERRTFYGCSKLETIIVPNSVTSIGDYAFQECSSLTTIVLPEEIKHIGANAFFKCIRLKNITIPQGITEIKETTFYGCMEITAANIPEGVTHIGAGAFGSCVNLESVIIPEGVVKIEDGAFQGCSKLQSVVIPEGVEKISADTFEGCTSLKNITLSESITSISYNAFSGCESLESVTLREGVEKILNGAFVGCTALNKLIIPTSLTYIDEDVFAGCWMLTEVYYTGSEDQWKEIVIHNGNEDLENAAIHYNYNG